MNLCLVGCVTKPPLQKYICKTQYFGKYLHLLQSALATILTQTSTRTEQADNNAQLVNSGKRCVFRYFTAILSGKS